MKVLCRPAHVSIKSKSRENSSAGKKDRLDYVKFRWKGSRMYRSSRSTTWNFFCQPTMMADIFEDFEAPFKKSLATPMQIVAALRKLRLTLTCQQAPLLVDEYLTDRQIKLIWKNKTIWKLKDQLAEITKKEKFLLNSASFSKHNKSNKKRTKYIWSTCY